MDITKDQFQTFIANTLVAHPEWVDAAIRGVFTGTSLAVSNARMRENQANLAMSATLSIIKRNTPVRERVLKMVAPLLLKVLPVQGGSPIEREWRKMAEAHDGAN